jgi:hypothetical protein
MTNTMELPSGKIIDLNRFAALIPYDKDEYHLILEGWNEVISVDAEEGSPYKTVEVGNS